MSDPLHDALVEATLATLLGSREVPTTIYSNNGESSYQGTVTVPSAFSERLNALARAGNFDELLNQAIQQVDVASVTKAIEGRIADLFVEGLKKSNSYSYDNWLQVKMKDIAVEACKMALGEDEELLDTLRGRIGAEVDRNRVGITVQLSDPEENK